MNISKKARYAAARNIFLSKKGFTLVEVFLAATLVGMILLTIFSTYSSGFKIWKATHSISSETKRKFSISMERMDREISGYIRDFEDIIFIGEKDNIVFPYVDGNEIVEVTYFFDKGDDTLWRKTMKFTESLKDKINKDITKLFEADKVEFSYLFYDERERSASWEDSFSEEDLAIPDAIRLDIRREGEKISEYVFIPK